MNVINDFPFRFSYYLCHPWIFFRHLHANLRDAHWRIKYGWAPRDVWNWDNWFLNVAPAMFKYLAENSSGYPGREPFETSEKWTTWLKEMAEKLENCREENYEKENEYYAEYMKQFENYDFNKENKELDEKYFAREHEIFEDVQKQLKECMTEISEYFFLLWD